MLKFKPVGGILCLDMLTSGGDVNSIPPGDVLKQTTGGDGPNHWGGGKSLPVPPFNSHPALDIYGAI